MAFPIIPLILLGLGIGAGAVATGCTPKQQKLPDLQPLDASGDSDVDSDTDIDTDTDTDTDTDLDTDTDTDTELDAGIDGGPDAGTDTDTDTDTDTGTDTATDTDTEMDAGLDAGDDAGLDGGPDTDTDTDTETDTYTDTDTDTGSTWLDYDCRFVFTDLTFPSMKYSMFTETVGAGEMQFKAAMGTDPAMEIERQTDPASTWPQLLQVVPSYALDLTGYYEFTASPIDPTEINVTFRSWDTSTSTLAFVDKMIFPVTWADTTTLDPQPIASDTFNEIYIGQNALLDIDADCDVWDSVESVCTQFSKSSIYFSLYWGLDLECWIP